MNQEGFEHYCSDKTFYHFTNLMKEGIDKGAKEYGEQGFAKNNVFLMMEEELRDLAVYAFLAYRKLHLMRDKFIEDVKGENSETQAKA